MKRTPTEEDIERALQESAKLASQAPKRKPQPYSSSAPHQGSSHSQTDQDAVDADLTQALYESQQLASSSAGPSFPSQSASGLHPQQAGSSRSPSVPMMPSPAAAAHAQRAPFPASSQPPSRLSQAQPAHQQPQASTSAPSQQAATGSVRYPEIFRPVSNSSSQAAPPSQSSQLQPSRHQNAPHQPQQGQHAPQYPVQTRQQPLAEPQHQQGASPSHAAGLYIDGYHGSANLESMLSADEAFARALQDEEFNTATAAHVHRAPPPPQPQQNPSPRQQQQPQQQQQQAQQPQQQQQQQATRPQAPASQPSKGVQSVAPVDKPGMCVGCGRSLSFLGFGGATVTLMGRTWHADCVKCGACQQIIPAAVKLGIGKEDNLPYHLSCYRNKFDPRCMVCDDLLPCGQVHSMQAGMLHASGDVEFLLSLHAVSTRTLCLQIGKLPRELKSVQHGTSFKMLKELCCCTPYKSVLQLPTFASLALTSSATALNERILPYHFCNLVSRHFQT